MPHVGALAACQVERAPVQPRDDAVGDPRLMRLPDHLLRHAVIALALVGAGFAGAWLRFLPYLEHEASFTDGDREVLLDDVERLRFAVWDEPVPLPPEINDGQAVGRATVSPDGRLLVFAAGEPGLNVDLWAAELVDGRPGEPWPLDRLNSGGDDTAPLFAGDWLWFASNRAGGEGGFDLLRAPLEDGLPGLPQRLPPGLNSEHDELDPAPVPGSPAVAFASDRPRGRRADHDLYLAVPFAVPVGSDQPAWRVTPLEDVNTTFEERGPAFALDGRALVFASDRSGGAGGLDLWRSIADLDGWLAPQPLAGLNTPADEAHPAPSPDGFALHFTSGAPPALQRARSIELFKVPGRPIGWLDLTVIGLLLLLALAAWLGKRWEALDILYKCLLVSLLVHLLMMLWFQEVAVESEPVELPEAAPTFRVRLSASPRVTARSAERNGQLDAAPSRGAEAAAPGRAEAGEVARAPASASAAAALAAPAVGGAAAPARQASDQPRGTVRSERAVQVADGQSDTTPLMTADAPALALAAAAGPAPTRGASPAASAPARDLAAAERFSGPAGEVAPRAPSLTVPVVTSGPGLPGPSRPVDPVSRAGSGAPVAAVELAAPPGEALDATGEQAAGASVEAPGLSLDALAAAGGGAPAGRRGPSRPGRAGFSAAPETGAPTPASLPALAAVVAAPAPVLADGHRPGGGAGPTLRELTDVALLEEGSDLTGSSPSPEPGEAPASLALAVSDTGASARRPSRPERPGRFAGRASLSDAADADPADPGFTPLEAPVAVAAAALPDLPRAAPHEHTPYRSRFGEARVSALEEHGGNEATERAVAAGLAYLASTQARDGHWGSEDDFHDKYGHVSVGKTGLALLAFLGAGHLPDGRSEHAAVARRARDFLLQVQDDDTGHFGYSASYSHAIATYALAECHALTGDARLRRPLERAVAWIVQHQDRSRDPRRSGGWGYYYPDGRIYDRWPRTSVTVWQVMALESAQLGGLTVERRVFNDAARFLRRARDAGGNSFTYSEDPERLRSVYPVLPGSTPAGLFALSLLGEDISGPAYREHVAFVVQRLPDRYEQARTRDFVHRAAGNLYFWYYGTLALFRHGGPEWQQWNEALQETLLPAQLGDGSWAPISLYADYAGDDNRDRSYTTALNVLTLEVYYRYFTPLLQVK